MQLLVEQKDIYRRYLSVHNLDRKNPSATIRSLVDTIGMRTPTAGALEVSLAARRACVDPRQVLALHDTHSLMRTIGIHGSILAIAVDSWRVCNASLAPVGEEEAMYSLRGAGSLLLPLGMDIGTLLHLATELSVDLLAGKSLTKRELGKVLADEALGRLPPSKREVWSWPSPMFDGQTLGESLMRFLLPLVCLAVPIELCRSPTDTVFRYTLAPFVDRATVESPGALAMRYIHAYGPTNVAEFSLWAGISPMHAKRLWDSQPSDALAEVCCEGHAGWMLQRDSHNLSTMPPCDGVRLLGPYDPLLAIPQRHLLVHGKSQHKYFFRSTGSPGMVLYDGKVVAGWSYRRKGNIFTLDIADIGEALGRVATEELESEAAHVAQALGLVFGGYSIARS